MPRKDAVMTSSSIVGITTDY
jgi:hypothetical protein